MLMGRATCPLLWAAALGDAQPCGVSLTPRGIASACLQYDHLTLVASVAGPLCLAGNPLLDCVPARLSPVAFLAPGDVCHGPRCSLAGLGPVAMDYRSCHRPGGSARLPQCVRPMGCRFFLSRPSATLRVCGVLGHLASDHRCARVVCCVASAVSWVTWLLFTGGPARCVVLRVRCPGPLGSCSLLCPLGALLCVCGVLGHLPPVHRCAQSVFCVACAVSWATWLLFTGAPAGCVVFCVRCPGLLGSCSPTCPLGGLCCMCGVLGHLAPVRRCARVVCCVACSVSWATWLLFSGAPARCVALCVRCPGPIGSLSPVCPLDVLCCVYSVLGHLAPLHRCACSVLCFACAVSWTTWLLFAGVRAPCVAWRVRCPGLLGSCSLVCPLGVLCCVCGVLGLPAPVHRSACSLLCFACAVSWATWLLFTGAPAPSFAFLVRCSGPLGSCSPVRPLHPLLRLCGVLGHLAPVHRCARVVCCVACAVSWNTWLLFTGAPAPSFALLVLCPGPLGCCSPVCPLGVSFCVCGVLGHLAHVHQCDRLVCCVACAVSLATWLLFTGMLPRWVVLRVRCPGLLGSCSPACSLCVLCFGLRVLYCVCGASLRGAHLSIRTAAVRNRLGLGTLRARTRPSRRRLFVAGRGWVHSGRALVHLDGCCS